MLTKAEAISVIQRAISKSNLRVHNFRAVNPIYLLLTRIREARDEGRSKKIDQKVGKV